MDNLQDVTLETVGGGVAVARFARELGSVLANIRDPNTDAKAVREINIKVQIKPTDDREELKTRVTVSSKLAPAKPVESSAWLGTRDGQLTAVAFNPNQSDMFRSEADSKVAPIGAAKSAGGAS